MPMPIPKGVVEHTKPPENPVPPHLRIPGATPIDCTIDTTGGAKTFRVHLGGHVYRFRGRVVGVEQWRGLDGEGVEGQATIHIIGPVTRE
jgi:hypothetical protein